jgi:hypothetical protein
MRRRIQDQGVAGKKVAAGCTSETRAHQPYGPRGEVHNVLLVTTKRVARGLEDEAAFVEGKIPLCILSAERELPDGGKMALPGKDKIPRGLLRRVEEQEKNRDVKEHWHRMTVNGTLTNALQHTESGGQIQERLNFRRRVDILPICSSTIAWCW